MAKTLWVQAAATDRKVIVSEYDPAHPGNHEAFIAGYPDTTDDTGAMVVGNPPIEVGDTALVRQRLSEGVLVEVSGPKAAAPVDTTKK